MPVCDESTRPVIFISISISFFFFLFSFFFFSFSLFVSSFFFFYENFFYYFHYRNEKCHLNVIGYVWLPKCLRKSIRKRKH